MNKATAHDPTPPPPRSRRVYIVGPIVCAAAAAALTVIGLPRDRETDPEQLAGPPAVESSTPAPDAIAVPGRAPLTLRFSKPMAAASLNPQSITLVGPQGAEPTRVVAAGAIAVIQPVQELLPASRYTLFVNGAADDEHRVMPLTAIGFDTAAKSAAPAPAGTRVLEASAQDWIPGPANFTGRWRADRAPSLFASMPPLQGPAGSTALTGQVLGMDGRAVPGVTLRIEGQEARTDLTGRFLIQHLAAGASKLEIDGATANDRDSEYGYYAVRVALSAGRTNPLPYTIWMPRLDPAGTVHIDAPTTRDTVVTSPRIPGLELHIPAGTVIRDRQGQIVTELNVTAIPVDRPPFPVPDLGVPVYFTVQPGGAVIQSATGKPGPGARLLYPNFQHEVPGARGTFWNYDPEDREWFVYGLGTISADATQAIPADGVVIHELTGAMFNGGNTPGPIGRPPCGDVKGEDCGVGGDPVELATGQFAHVEYDSHLGDVISIDIARTYMSGDVNKRAFGVGMTHDYDIFLYSQNQWQEVDVILPNGSQIHYVRTSPGTGFADAIFQSSAPGRFHNSVIARNQARAGWDLTLRDGVHWFFPQFQPVTELADRNGNVLHIVREANGGTSGKVIQVVSPNGRSVDFTYNAAGLVSAITDNVGRIYAYNYDTDGQLTSVVDPAGGTRTYTWDLAKHRITDIHDERGNLVVHNQYDAALGYVTHQTLGDGSSYAYDYTMNGCPLPPPGTQPPPGSCAYHIAQTKLTDRSGTVRFASFDSKGRVQQNTFAAGLPEQKIVTYEFSNDLLSAIVDPLGRRTEFLYDANGNITRKTRMAGTAFAASWNTTWDPVAGMPSSVTDPNGHGSTLTYDTRGNATTVQNEPGKIWSYSYDAQGRRLTSTNPLGKVTTWVYEAGDPVSVTGPTGRQAQFLFDAAGRMDAAVDALGNRTVTRWDDLDRTNDTTDAAGGVISFSHDSNGNVLNHTDAKGHVTTYSYNANNQPLQRQDPTGAQTAFSYDTAGRLAQQTDSRGKLQVLSYDALGRLKRISSGSTPAQPAAFTRVIENTWDAADRITQIVEKTCGDPAGHLNCTSVATISTISRAYDNFDYLTQEITSLGEVDYVFDSSGRRLSRTIKNGAPGAQTVQPIVTYSYDAADRLSSITQAAGAINGHQARSIAFTYDDVGRRAQTTLANGTTITNTYDDGGKVIAILYKKADSTLIGDLQYEYDAAGRRISMGGSLARLGLPTADVTDGTYDAADRLLTWAGKTYSYDNQGSLTSDGANTYVWDGGNRLTAINSGATTLASFQYDSLGRRIGKTVNATTTGFVYDRDNVAQELTAVSSTAPVKTHLLTGGLDQVFLRLEGNTGSSQQSVLSDANNHTIGLLDASQVSSVSYTYDPYGVTASSAANGNPQQYTGRENDNPGDAGGLYYYRARYYMPGIARFISPDPIGWASGQINRYAYVGGDPISFRDPSGLDGMLSIAGAGGGLGGLGGFGGFGGRRHSLDEDDDSGVDALDREIKANKAGKAAKGPRATEGADLEDRLARAEGIEKAQRDARAAGVGDAKIASIAKTEQNLATELRGIKSGAQLAESEAEVAAATARVLAAEKQVEGVFEVVEEGAEAEEGASLAVRIIMFFDIFE